MLLVLLPAAAGLAGIVTVPIAAAVLALVAPAIVVIAWAQRRTVVTDDTPESMAFGYLGVVRSAMAISVGLILVTGHSPGANVVPISLSVVLLVGAVVLEPILSRLSRVKLPFVANMPTMTTVPGIPQLAGVVVGGNLVAIVLGLICGWLRLSGWLWFVISVLSLIPAGILVVTGRNRMLQGKRLDAAIGPAVAAYAPEFIVYTSRPDDASYQVAMWLPYLQRSGRRFIIVTRDEIPARALAAVTDVPIVQRLRLADLEDVVPSSLRAVFYVNASSGNGAFVRYSQLTHVYLGHGDSDKPPSYNPTHAMYDTIFAAGPAATRRYAAHGVTIPADKFEIVGRPQVEGVLPAAGPISAVEQPTVLYAPTWRGHVAETMLDSLPIGERIVAALLERGVTVIFRPHPFSYSFPDDAATIARIHQLLAADTQQTGRSHLWGPAAETERGILDCINESDAMVSDVSSVVSDYLFSGKPFAMVAVPSAVETFIADYPVARAAYVLDGQLANLAPVLDAMLGPDPAQDRRTAIRVDYLGDFPVEGYADAFVAAVRRVSDAPLEDTAIQEPEEATGASTGKDLSSLRRQLAAVSRDLLVTGTALLSLVVGLLSGPVLLAALFGWLAAAGMVFAQRRVLARQAARPRLVGSFDVARTVLVLAIGVVALNRGRTNEGGISGWTVAALCLLLFAVAGERAIKDGWGRRGLEVSGLPELHASVSELVPRQFVWLVHWAVTVLGWLLVLVGAPAVIWFVLAVVQFALFAGALLRSSIRVFRVVEAEQHLRRAVADYAPQFALYFSSSVGAAYQIGMWLPYLQRIERPFIIVVRSVPMMRAVAALTDVPVIHRPTLRSLEEVIVPSLRAAFYVNNAVRNTHFVERRELTHVWLNHGDSEKPACYNPVHAIYDTIFAAGQAGIDRYARHGVQIPRSKFQIVGRPQVEVIEQARAPMSTIAQPTVLYAPTWQGPYADSAVCSLPQGRQIVQGLLDRGVRVVFRAHPFNYRFPNAAALISDIGDLLAAAKARTGLDHLWGHPAEETMTIEDCFNASDAMISDVSAVVSDYLQSAKPFSIVSIGRTPEQLLDDAPAARAAYVLRENLTNLDAVLGDLLDADPLAGARDDTRVYYLGNFPADNYAQGFVEAARAVVDRPPPEELISEQSVGEQAITEQAITEQAITEQSGEHA